MPITKIQLKYGSGNPGTVLDISEPAIDLSTGILYIGTGYGKDPVIIDTSLNNIVDPALDYNTYSPRVSQTVFTKVGNDISNITIDNSIGTKTVDFNYAANGNIDTIDISTYGLSTREVSFVYDSGNEISQINIIE